MSSRSVSRPVAIGGIILLLAACGARSADDGGVDAGGDSPTDGGSPDAGTDGGGTDVGPLDLGPPDEGPFDLGVDGGVDVGVDGGVDAGPDAGPDFGPDDGPFDAGPDLGPPDFGPDVGPPDNGPDLGMPGACTSNADCAATEFCDKPDGMCSGSGTCATTPGPICPLIFDPHCGCDGVDYGNRCEMNAARQSASAVGPCP